MLIVLLVIRCCGFDGVVEHLLAVVQHDTAAAKLLRRGACVGDEQHRHVFVHHDLADAGDTLALERAVAHR